MHNLPDENQRPKRGKVQRLGSVSRAPLQSKSMSALNQENYKNGAPCHDHLRDIAAQLREMWMNGEKKFDFTDIFPNAN